MTLEEFKSIWHMEYGHRMWGRALGAAFLFPAIYFWKKRWLSSPMKKRVLIFGSLILCQVFLLFSYSLFLNFCFECLAIFTLAYFTVKVNYARGNIFRQKTFLPHAALEYTAIFTVKVNCGFIVNRLGVNISKWKTFSLQP